MAISHVGVNNAAGQASGSAAASTVSITPTTPGSLVDNQTRVFVFQEYAGTAGSTPAGWTALFKDAVVGSAAAASGSGLRKISCYYRDKTSGWSAIPAFTLTSVANNSHWIGVEALNKTSTAYTWNTPTFTAPGGSFNAVTTSYTDSSASSFTTHAGGFLMIGSCFNDNVTSSAAAVSQSGATFGAVTERCDGGTGTGFIVSGKLHTASVTTGASATITQTQTISANSQGESVFIEQTETAPPPADPAEDLTDDYATQDNAKWDYATAGGGAVVSGGQLSITATFLDSVDTYDLTSSYIYAEIINSGSTASLGILNATTFSTGVSFDISGTDLSASSLASGPLHTATYNATSHRWLRIREASGTVFWETSANGSSWSAFHSASLAVATAWTVELFADSALFDNFNTAPAATNTGAFFAML